MKRTKVLLHRVLRLVFLCTPLLLMGQNGLSTENVQPLLSYDHFIHKDHDFIDYVGARPVLDTEGAESIERELRQAKQSHDLIPEKAKTAESQKEFVRIVIEYHLRNLMESSSFKNTRLAQNISATERVLKGGLEYEWDQSESNKGSKKSGLRAYLEPRLAQAHLQLNAFGLQTELFHSFESNTEEIAISIPVRSTGELKMGWELSSTAPATINYEANW